MTKQEEIREEIAGWVAKERGLDVGLLYSTLTSKSLIQAVKNCWSEADDMLRRLHSQGVVIKVDCPECNGDGRIQKFFDRTFSNRCPKCNGYGYVATIPIIEEIDEKA